MPVGSEEVRLWLRIACVSSCFLDVLHNDGDSVNFSTLQLELGYVSDDDDEDSVAAGLARVKPNA